MSLQLGWGERRFDEVGESGEFAMTTRGLRGADKRNASSTNSEHETGEFETGTPELGISAHELSVGTPSNRFWNTTFTFLLRHIDEGIHAIDTQGITRIYNRKMAELEAMSPADVLGRPVLDVVRFAKDGDSTLLRAVRTGEKIRNTRQTYFNNQGRAITTVNDTFPILDPEGTLIGAVEIARDVTQMEQILQSSVHAPLQFTFERIIGQDANFIAVLEDARRTARTMSSVLIIGETGTGKELVAQSIHQAGSRSSGPFVSQNCAALPESLIEGLLFGTVRGAFTGAIDRPGLIEQANGGTLLLDEINALSPDLQAKLLRVLQERRVRRVGAATDKSVDTRIVATMNEDPIDAIAANRLRKDLYYRLGVVTLFLPPLRDRRDDIPVLTAHFIDKYNQLFHLHVTSVEPALMGKFMNYSWPGNVRELEHAIEGAMNLLDGATVIDERTLPYHIRRRMVEPGQTGQTGNPQQLDDGGYSAGQGDNPAVQGDDPSDLVAQSGALAVVGITAKVPEPAMAHTTLQAHLSEYERTYIENVLNQCNGNISAAARELGVSRQNLQYRLRRLQLR